MWKSKKMIHYFRFKSKNVCFKAKIQNNIRFPQKKKKDVLFYYLYNLFLRSHA